MMPHEQEQVLADGVSSDRLLLPGLCGVALAAGAGTRLQPLTHLRPKPLCPVGEVALIDLTLGRLQTVTDDVAVNLHHGREALAAHLQASTGRVPHLSVEEPVALGTAGALGQLRPWIAGRDAVVLNADTWCPGSLADAAAGWDRERVRLLVAGNDTFTPRSQIAGAFLPWSAIATLTPTPSGLYEACWRRLAAEGKIDAIRWDGPCIDCGTPASYLAANMAASDGQSVIGAGATVAGTVERSVVWAEAIVHPAEHLVNAIRTDREITVLVRDRTAGPVTRRPGP